MGIDATGSAGGLAILWNPHTILLETFFHFQVDHLNEFVIGSNRPGF
jgi:hypothetical protein